MKRIGRNGASARGFTMLEVLISIVVIAFGMLGVAGLQAYALKNSQGASYRSIATVLATDLIDRIRANPTGATGNFYANGTSQGPAAQVAACATASGCSPQELASNDLFEWQALIAASLPGGGGIVCRDLTPNDGQPPTNPANSAPAACDGNGSLVIKIWWVDNRNKKADNEPRLFHFWTAFVI